MNSAPQYKFEPADQPVGSAAQAPVCQDCIVEVVHMTGDDKLYLLTQSQVDALEREELIFEQLMQRMYTEAVQAGSDRVSADGAEPQAPQTYGSCPAKRVKEEVSLELANLGVIPGYTPPSDGKPVSQVKLTEIKRLSGKQHYTYVRADKMRNHWRSYDISSLDRNRSKGWLTAKGFDPAKLKEAIESETKLKLQWYKSVPPDHVLNQLYDEANISIWGDKAAREEAVKKTGFDASAGAQFMRFAAGAGVEAEFDPKQGVVNLQGKAEASYTLFEGKVTVEQSYPPEDQSQWLIRYRIGGPHGELRTASLGHFQLKALFELNSFAGASALLAANVQLGMKNGTPQIKGLASGQPDQAPGVDGGLFAGVQAGCKLGGQLQWTDTLAEGKPWKALCALEKGVQVSAGLGAEIAWKLKISPETGKFYFQAHAGAVMGLGAKGEVALAVDMGNILEVVHFIYNNLLEVDFRYIESIDNKAFDSYIAYVLYALSEGIELGQAFAEHMDEALVGVADIAKAVEWSVRKFFADASEATGEFLDEHRAAYNRERRSYLLARNICQDIAKGEASWVRHAPPEVKGRLIHFLMYDYAGTILDIDTEKEIAILQILRSIQSWRDYQETLSRITAMGSRGDYDANRKKLTDYLPFWFEGKWLAWEEELEAKKPKAQPNQPVRLDCFGELCSSSKMAF